MFDWHVRDTQEGIMAVQRAIETRQRAMEILKDYEFKADKVVPRVYRYGAQAGSNTTTVFG
ncbi:MAG: hypothetical protein WA441_10725 [Methyloceanibacter sp.]